MATQTIGQNFVKFIQASPHNTTERGAFTTGGSSRFEFDAVGAKVRNFNFTPADRGGNPGDLTGSGGPVDSRYSSLANPGAGCTMDGIYMPCYMALRGAGTSSDVVYVDPFYAASSRAGSSRLVWVEEDTSTAVRTGDNELTIYAGPGGHYEWVDDPDDVLELSTQQKDTIIEKPFTEAELDAIRAEIVKIVSTGPCGEFLSRLLTNAGAGDDPPVQKNIVDLFDMVRKQGGFVSASLRTSTGATRSYSSIQGAAGAPGGAKLLLSSGSDNFKGHLRIQYHAYNALSELTHVAGTQLSNYVEGAFSDFNLANEAHALALSMGTGVPNLNLTPPPVNPYDDQFGKWSDYYHGIVKLFCKRNER